ncbi:unnamed protein product [Ectocarpus sp. CCAP 1310/34]|nr:unnamed protein product [Ectocarpus sp. CCAP 1310/34]
MADEAYSEQQKEARQEAKVRRERGIAEAEREKLESGGKRTVEFQRRSWCGKLGTAGSRSVKWSAARRQSDPGVGNTEIGAERKSRKKPCRRAECGWFTNNPGLECSMCPSGVVHAVSDKLCSACHRSEGLAGFTHLRGPRLERATRFFLAEYQEGEGELPLPLVRGFCPSNDCISQRRDCFYGFLLEREAKPELRTCSVCKRGYPVKDQKRWYSVDVVDDNITEGGGSGRTQAWYCQACNQARIRAIGEATQKKVAASSNSGRPNADEPAPEKPFSRVRALAIKAVAAGTSFAGRMCSTGSQLSAQRMVTKSVGAGGRPCARCSRASRALMGVKRGWSAARWALETGANDYCVYSWSTLGTRFDGPSTPANATSGGNTSLQKVRRLLEEAQEADARMEIVRAAAEIVRAYVDQHPDLKNARLRRKKHKYSVELAAPVKPVRDALAEMPPTLIGLFRDGPQPSAARSVRREDDGSDEADALEGAACERQAPTRNATRAEEVDSAGSTSEAAAISIETTNQDRRGFARRLYMLCKCTVKAIFPGRHLTAADIKGAQWAKSKGTCRQVIDFVAGHGLWATTSQVQHREDYHAKVVEDKDILPKGAQCAAIANDNCDNDPRVGERQGKGPHISFIAATAVTVGDDVVRMQDAASLRRRRSLTVDQITKGLDQEEGDRRFKDFERTLRRAAVDSVLSSSSEDSPWTCVESEIRKHNISPSLA